MVILGTSDPSRVLKGSELDMEYNMTSETKLCVNCRWYRRTQYSDQCWHPSVQFKFSESLVGSRHPVLYSFCDPCRSHDGHCKPEAIHWEPRLKLTIFERIRRSLEV